MSQLFKRAVKLTAENLDKEETTTIENLQVEFHITRTLGKEPSTLAATVYNLSADTRAKLERPNRIILTLSAGYGDDLHSLFKGDLRLVRHTRDGANIATYVEAGDGEKGVKNWVKRNFPKNVGIRRVFEFLIDKAQIGTGNLSEGLAIEETNGLPDQLRAGLFVRGYAVDELAELCKSRGIDFSVQDGEAQFLPIGGFKGGVPITVVDAETGLVGSPSLDNEGIMSCSTLLLPHVFPGSAIELESEFVSGQFKVIRADYTGSVFGPDFNIDIEGKEIT